MKQTACLCSALLLAFFFSLPATASDASEEADTLEKLRLEMVAAINNGDMQTAITYFDPDATLMIQGLPPVKGLEAIRQMAGMIFPGGTSIKVSMEIEQRGISGSLAYETGRLVVTNSAEGGVSRQGKFISIWRKGADNQWKLVVYSPSTNSMGG